MGRPASQQSVRLSACPSVALPVSRVSVCPPAHRSPCQSAECPSVRLPIGRPASQQSIRLSACPFPHPAIH
eukprot:365402-Chlamydomonas_euryale.AAC.10